MTSINYHKAKEKLQSIYDLDPPVAEISKYIKLMYFEISKDLGSSCKQEIEEKIVNDAIEIGIPKEQIQKLLLMEGLK